MKPETSRPSALLQKVNRLRGDLYSKIEAKNPDSLWRRASLKDVRKAVIICCASRSGSSLLYALLKKIPSFYSLAGESVPFLKCNGFTGDSFLSDEIPGKAAGDEERQKGLSRDFLNDFSASDGSGDILGDEKALESYIDDLALRFPLQWPEVSFSREALKRSASAALALIRRALRGFDKEEFYLEMIRLLRSDYKTINPYYYDIPAQKIKKKFPLLEVPSGPPSDVLTIEEPPFILLSPSRKPDVKELGEKTLILKSSADCYRVPFIKKLLPNADIKIVYMARNPAASINGLCDGWLHRGFFSHNVKNFSRLRIAGYSDHFEWGRRWWNYDLPPGWQDYAGRSLEEVCAFQWYSANKAVQAYLNKAKTAFCPIRYENLTRSLKSRIEAINRVVDFVRIKDDPVASCGLDRLPLVQATEAPQRYRWKKRMPALAAILDRRDIKKMSASLGYHKDRMEEWL